MKKLRKDLRKVSVSAPRFPPEGDICPCLPSLSSPRKYGSGGEGERKIKFRSGAGGRKAGSESTMRLPPAIGEREKEVVINVLVDGAGIFAQGARLGRKRNARPRRVAQTENLSSFRKISPLSRSRACILFHSERRETRKGPPCTYRVGG